MKNREMKSYLNLIPISAKVRRKQNRLILLCIIFAVFLVTTVFTMAEIFTKSEEESMLKKHGVYHIEISGISDEQAQTIGAQDSVAAAAWHRSFGEDIYEGYEVDGKRVILYGTEAAYIEAIRNYQWEGMYPQNDQEVMLNEISRERLGVGLGDSITVNTPAGDFTYTVTGFCVDEWQQYNDKYDGVTAYMSLDALEGICGANGYGDGDSDTAADENGREVEEPVYYVQFAKGTAIREVIDNLKAQYQLGDGNIHENLIAMGFSGESSNQTVNGMYITAAIVFVMILIAGVLMISSCMNSTVSQRTKFFGMMRCIGASRKQVMRFVRLEALNWCKTAIPFGLGISIAGTWIMSLILRYKVGGEFSEFSFRFSVIGIVSGILVGVVSVLLAAHSPAKRAAAVSPVAAVSGNAETGKKVSRAANTRIFKVESGLGVYHATAAKKNLILLSLSIAFTVALFLAFFAGLDLAKRMLPSESDLNPDISIAAMDNENSLMRSMKDEMAKVPGVEAAFGCAMSLDVAAKINGAPGSVDLVSYDDYMFQWTKKSIVSGSLKDVVGDTDYVFTIFNMDSRLDTGDLVTIGDTQLEIAAVCSEGIGTQDRPAIVCTEETFRRLTGEENYMMLEAQLTKEAAGGTVEALRTIAGENEFLDRREENETSHSSFWVFRLAAYGFLGIIALIMMFNIMNNISMSVQTRIKQYGAMRAVGMSVGQMTGMIAAEAVTYAVSGLIIGYMAGLYLHRLIMEKILFTHFGGSWKIPFKPIVIIMVIIACSCAIAVYTPSKRIKNMAITETINEL